MKKLILSSVGLLMITFTALAQVPQRFNFQGIARTSEGIPITNQDISLKISVIDGSVVGDTEYQETHDITTNDFGLYAIAIGGGTVLTGTMGDVNWSSTDKFIKAEIDPDGGTDYTDLGITQLLSVPYALYAGEGGWGLSGNSASEDHFIGTTNDEDIRFKRNDVRVGRIGENNIAIGRLALNEATTGQYNNAIGLEALRYNTTGDYNTAIGHWALRNNTTGNYNTAIGRWALRYNTIGSYNNAIGNQALYKNITGDYNVAIGSLALIANETGNHNNAIGRRTLMDNKMGHDNNAMGHEALLSNISGTNNSAIGFHALYNNTTGNYNVAIGRIAGSTNKTGSQLTMVGNNSDVNSSNYTRSGAFGVDATITASMQYRVGAPIGSQGPSSIGGRVAWTTVSDGRFKKNVKADVPGLAFIKELRPVTYNMDDQSITEFLNMASSRDGESINPDAGTVLHTGFIAQDVEAAAQKIGFDFHGVDKPKNDKDYYGIRYAEFVVPLVKAVQEQQEIIDEQNKKIERLEQLVQNLIDQNK